MLSADTLKFSWKTRIADVYLKYLDFFKHWQPIPKLPKQSVNQIFSLVQTKGNILELVVSGSSQFIIFIDALLDKSVQWICSIVLLWGISSELNNIFLNLYLIFLVLCLSPSVWLQSVSLFSSLIYEPSLSKYVNNKCLGEL